MKYLPYVLKHLRKNWIRTLSTVLGMAVCIFLFCTLQTLLAAINDSISSASAQRLWTRHAVSLVFDLPLAYKARIEAVPGVTQRRGLELVRRHLPGPEELLRQLRHRAAAVSRDVVRKSRFLPTSVRRCSRIAAGRSSGEASPTSTAGRLAIPSQLESTIPPYRVGKPFEFVVRAIYDVDRGKYPGYDINSMFFHYEYLYERTESPRRGRHVRRRDRRSRTGGRDRAGPSISCSRTATRRRRPRPRARSSPVSSPRPGTSPGCSTASASPSRSPSCS